MFFPELLYQLSARDQQVSWLDPSVSRITAGAAAPTVTANLLTVPAGLALILQALSVGLDPGAAQSILNVAFRILPPAPAAAPEVLISNEWFVLTANQNRAHNWQGSVLVPPGWRLACVGTFDAGAANNVVDASHMGILIPIGNVQRI